MIKSIEIELTAVGNAPQLHVNGTVSQSKEIKERQSELADLGQRKLLAMGQPISPTASLNGPGRRQSKQGRSVPRKPRRQGDGDALCGFYTIINGLRLALRPHGGLSRDQEAHIWRSLIRHADRNWRFATLFLDGIMPIQFIGLARRGAYAATKLTGTRVTFRFLTKAEVQRRNHRLQAIVEDLMAQGHASILTGLEGKNYSHWSIIRGATRKSIWLLDSGGHHHFRLTSCRLLRSPKPKQNPRYWVKLYGVFTTANAMKNDTVSKKEQSHV
jgi:hypothetical protein